MRRLLLIAALLCAPVSAQEEAPVVRIGSPTQVPSTTVAGLPTCNAGATGFVYLVTNALVPVLGSAVAGGGAVSVLVKCNGTNWLVGQ